MVIVASRWKAQGEGRAAREEIQRSKGQARDD